MANQGIRRAVLVLLVAAYLWKPLYPQVITTVVGGQWVFRGDGGLARSAPLGDIWAVATAADGSVYAADGLNCLVVKATPSGSLHVVAGNGFCGYSGDGGPATSAAIVFPSGIAVDSADSLYISDPVNERIRKISAKGTITTVAGTGQIEYSGDNGPAISASLDPGELAVDAAGNLYVSDDWNGRVRKISPTGVISTVAGGGRDTGDGGSATSASLNNPRGLAVDQTGNLHRSGSHRRSGLKAHVPMHPS